MHEPKIVFDPKLYCKYVVLSFSSLKPRIRAAIILTVPLMVVLKITSQIQSFSFLDIFSRMVCFS
jgi:hypothetical protein